MGTSFRFGSHLPVLIKCVEKTVGDILELGCGESSTIFLHWACLHKERKLVTMESKKNYYDRFRKIKNHCHTVLYVPDWSKAVLSGDWSVVLIDQSPGFARGMLLPKFVDAEYVVCHDSHVTDKTYGYDFSLFKYRFDYKPKPEWIPQTTVVSNKHNLEGLMDDA